jgi:ABC-2 type transport system ATP-binding protein
VEQVADHVTMISQGTIVQSAPMEALKESHRCVTVHFAESRPRPPAVAGVLCWDGGGREWTAVVHRDSGELEDAVAGWGGRVVTERAPSLDELFIAHVGTPAAPAEEV